MKMIRACKRHKIDMIITKSISRFSRNTLDCLKYIRILKELNVDVFLKNRDFTARMQVLNSILQSTAV